MSENQDDEASFAGGIRKKACTTAGFNDCDCCGSVIVVVVDKEEDDEGTGGGGSTTIVTGSSFIFISCNMTVR